MELGDKATLTTPQAWFPFMEFSPIFLAEGSGAEWLLRHKWPCRVRHMSVIMFTRPRVYTEAG